MSRMHGSFLVYSRHSLTAVTGCSLIIRIASNSGLLKNIKLILMSITRQRSLCSEYKFVLIKNNSMSKKFFFISLLLASFSFTIHAQDAATRQKQFNLDNSVAISGYDPVAYFKLNQAVKGKKELALSQQGVTYYFSN